MRRFTPFIVIGILLLCSFIVGLIFDKSSDSFSIWNQLTPPERGKIACINSVLPPYSVAGKSTINLVSIIPIPRPGGGKPTIFLVSIIQIPRPGGGKPTMS